MKKIVILILSIILIAGVVIIYKHVSSKNTELNEIENNQLKPVTHIQKDYFLMYVDETSNNNTGVILKGTILKGNIKLNDEISIVGLNRKEVTARILKIKVNNEEKDSAKEGEFINLEINSDIPKDYIMKGEAVIKTGTTKPVYNIDAEIKSLTADNITELEKNIDTFFINTDLKCSIKVISEKDNILRIKLEEPIVMDEGIEFSLKNGDKIVAKCECITIN